MSTTREEVKTMKLPKLSRQRPLDRPLAYAPDSQEYLLRQQREVPRPVHLGFR